MQTLARFCVVAGFKTRNSRELWIMEIVIMLSAKMEKRIQSQKNNKDLENFRKELKSIIINEGIKFGEGLDKNSRLHKWTSDTKSFLLDPHALHLTTELFTDRIRRYQPDAVGGLTLASHLI